MKVAAINEWADRLVGLEPQRYVKLTAAERKTLGQALVICDRGDDLSREIADDPDHYTAWTDAAHGLREVLERLGR